MADHVAGWKVDLVLCSTARRARETAKPVIKTLGCRVRYEDALYTAVAEQLLDIVKTLSDRGDEDNVLIGHNPSLEELTAILCGESIRYPTAALGTVNLSIERWDEVSSECGTLAAFVVRRPLRGERARLEPPPSSHPHIRFLAAEARYESCTATLYSRVANKFLSSNPTLRARLSTKTRKPNATSWRRGLVSGYDLPVLSVPSVRVTAIRTGPIAVSDLALTSRTRLKRGEAALGETRLALHEPSLRRRTNGFGE